MPRVKGGYTTRRRRKAVLKLAKGYYGSKHTLYKTAHEQVMRSLAYAYRDRKNRQRDFRKLWLSRINAEMAVNDADGFAKLCDTAKKALAKKPKAVQKENVVYLKPQPKSSK